MEENTATGVSVPNREAIRLWVDALVSGDYPQGREQLLDKDGGHCCMGVAAVVCPLPIARAVTESGWVLFEGIPDWMPPTARGWLGLHTTSPSVAAWDWLTEEEQEKMSDTCRTGQPLRAHEANDVLEWSLEKIGRSIERYYLSDEAVVAAQ